MKSNLDLERLIADYAAISAGEITIDDVEKHLKPLFNREKEWLEFMRLVQNQIVGYTIPQYGDAPNDQIEAWSPAEVMRAIGKRCARFGKQSRPGQDLIDMLKIAHEACIAYHKLVAAKMGHQCLERGERDEVSK